MAVPPLLGWKRGVGFDCQFGPEIERQRILTDTLLAGRLVPRLLNRGPSVRSILFVSD